MQRKRRIHREISPAARKRWNAEAEALLVHAQTIFDMSANWDTAVRDSTAKGLAYIVHAAYDCQACAIDFANTDAWMAFIDAAVAQWFREREFAEWFCVGAANLFQTTPPRHIAGANEFNWTRTKTGKRIARIKEA